LALRFFSARFFWWLLSGFRVKAFSFLRGLRLFWLPWFSEFWFCPGGLPLQQFPLCLARVFLSGFFAVDPCLNPTANKLDAGMAALLLSVACGPAQVIRTLGTENSPHIKAIYYDKY